MPLTTRSRYRRTSLTWPAAITTVPGSPTSARALMSLSGSPDADRSTNRIFGLAETDSDCTALRRPPLLTFSGAQPISTATGRIASAVVSSQTNAMKGSRWPTRPELNGAIKILATRALGLDHRPAGAGRRGAAESIDRLARRGGVDRFGARLAAHEVGRIGDHRGEVGIDRAHLVRRGVGVEVGVAHAAEIGATGHGRLGPADHDAGGARCDRRAGDGALVRQDQAVARDLRRH